MLGTRSLVSAPLLGILGESAGTAGPREILLSDLGWTGKPTDSAYPNRIFRPRVVEPLNIERAIPIVPGGARRSTPSVGDILLVNADGGLDDLYAAPIDGRPVTVYQGRPGGDFSDFELLFKGTSAAWRDADDARIALSLRGASWRLDVPLERPLYAGTGGIEGGADIKGKSKPAAFGRCRNIPLVLVNAALQIYQFHFRQAAEVEGVFDGGAPYTPAGDVVDILATVVAAGQFKTQLSAGLIRLGTAPTKTLSANVRGDAANSIYVERAADIAFRVLHDLQGLDDGWFEINTFDALNLAYPGPIQIYLGLEPIAASTVLDEIMAGIDGWWSENLAGRIELGVIGLPVALPRATLKLKDLFEVSQVPLPEAIDPPFWRVRVGYGRNWTPLDVTQIAQSIVTGDPARYAFLTEEYRFCDPVEDVLIKSRNLRAQELTLLSAYVNEADAQALAQRLFNIYSTPRRLVRLRTKRQGQKIPLGATIAIDYPRYGLAGGRNVVVTTSSVSASTFDCNLTVLY